MNRHTGPTDADLRKTEQLSPESRQRHDRASARRAQRFIYRIPLPWLERVAALGGRGPVLVGLALWFRSGLWKTTERIKLTPTLLRPFCVDRKTVHRALQLMEQKGLVSVERRRGRSPIVTILT